nr:hypothetical protein [uncultured Celeribacter sp.]
MKFLCLKTQFFQILLIALFMVSYANLSAKAEEIVRIRNTYTGAGEVLVVISLEAGILTVRRDFFGPCFYDKHPKFIQRKIRLEDIGRIKIFSDPTGTPTALEIRIKEGLPGPLAYEVEAKNCFNQNLQTDMKDYEFIFGSPDAIHRISEALN